MKFWTTLAPMAALLLIVSCGGKKDGDAGFDSPKALIDDMLETQKKGSIDYSYGLITPRIEGQRVGHAS